MSNLALFNGPQLSEYLEAQTQRIEKLVLGIGAQRLVSTDIEEIVLEITKKLRVEPIVLLEESINVTSKETRIDVANNPFHFVSNRGRSVLVSGTKVTYYIPFQGNAELLKLKPNHYGYNLPETTKIIKNELILEYITTDGNVKETKPDFDRAFRTIKQWVDYLNAQIERHNQSLDKPIRFQLLNRQKILISSQQQISELGYQIRPKQVRTSKPKTQTKEAAKPASTSKAKTQPREIVKPTSTSKAKASTKEAAKTSRTSKVIVQAKKPAKAKPKSIKAKKVSEKKKFEELEYDVALSFAGEDRAYVDKVARRLRTKKIRVFYDKFNKAKLWGNNLIDHLGEVYSKKSRFIVMFISKHYAEKEWTNHERKFAQEREFKLKKTCILPARFDNTPIPGLNSTLGYVDLQTITPNELVDLIIERIND